MPRPPLQIGTWGKISRQQKEPGRWVARARFRDSDGVTRKVEAWGSTGAAAERALVARMSGRIPPTDSDLTAETTVATLAETWWREDVEPSERTANTRTKYRGLVDKHVIPGIGGVRIREATPGLVGRYLKRVEHITGAPTARSLRAVLSGMFELAVLADACQRNPVRDAPQITVKAREVEAIPRTTIPMVRAALAGDTWARGVDLPDLFDTLLATGARLGEVLALRWQDVNLEAGTVTFSGTVVRTPEGVERQGHTKGKRPRVITVAPFGVEVLRRRRATPVGQGCEIAFPSQALTWREASNVGKLWRKFLARHPDLPPVTLHSVRRTVATAIERGNGLASASAVLGHTSGAVTSKHYVEKHDVAPDVSATVQGLVESAG